MNINLIQHLLHDLTEAFENNNLYNAISIGSKLCETGDLGTAEAISLANILKEQGDIKSAIELYRNWLSNSKKNTAFAVNFNLSILLQENFDYDGAILEAKIAITLNPAFIEGYINLGILYEKIQQPEKAITIFELALNKIELNKTYSVKIYSIAYNNLGRLLQSQNRFNQAAELYTKSLELLPNQAEIKVNLENSLELIKYGDAFPPIYTLNEKSLSEAKTDLQRMRVMQSPCYIKQKKNSLPFEKIEQPHFYCISHGICDWSLPKFMTIFGTGNYIPESGISLQIQYPHLINKNRFMGEYVALFAIRDFLRQEDQEKFVGVSHYRRFALTRKVGHLRGFNYHAHPNILQTLTNEDFYGNGLIPVVPAVVSFRCSVLTQYAVHSDARDLLIFFGDAIDVGVITSLEAAIFLSENTFIIAPTVAYIPISWFVEIIDALEKVMNLHYSRHMIKREGYQERSMAFCCERLHAFLLLKYLRNIGFDKIISQPLTVLSANKII